jgi:hypothetical protein
VHANYTRLLRLPDGVPGQSARGTALRWYFLAASRQHAGRGKLKQQENY